MMQRPTRLSLPNLIQAVPNAVCVPYDSVGAGLHFHRVSKKVNEQAFGDILARFRAGEDAFLAIEAAELGEISGKRVLHLQQA
jgi:hypothetical protein